ncbi:MAG: hypothetical protein CMQ53_04975 [Gammaproteobacteria bacterium]|nr:hypothetical protein [Gammaproteobacteria bacterium]|tara:strand:- start:4236 stop:4532 length:297 start_codon:yes stop_codon:yes gene_type:complete
MNIGFKIVGYVAAFLLSFLLVPQTYKTFKSKNIKAISSYFLYFQLITTILWIIYGMGFLIDNSTDGIPIVIANSSLLLNTIFLLYLKYQDNNSQTVQN